MTKTRKPPVRTCLGCGQECEKHELVRLVRTPEGDVVWDPSGKANGRGAYVHPDPACFEGAVRKRRVPSALRVTLKEDDVERLRRDLQHVLEKRSLTGR